jgi:transposase
MEKRYRPRRDFDALEARRKKAGRFFASGRLTQAEIARAVGASRTSVMRWYRAWRSEGTAGLRKAGRAGRKPRLSAKELKQVDRLLREGARAFGFSTDLWTLPRVAKAIEEVTGCRYHPGHVWRVLLSLNWSLQRPARQAKERNAQEIRRWVKEEWPRVKKTRGAGGPGSSSKTRAASPIDLRSGAAGRRKGRPRS